MAFNITDFRNTWANFKEDLKGYLNKAVDKTGDTMQGKLILASSPTEDMEATTKKYVDDLDSANKEYADNYWKWVPGDRVIRSGSMGIALPIRPGSSENWTQKVSALDDNWGFVSYADGMARLKGYVSVSIPKVDVSNTSSTWQEINSSYDIYGSITISYQQADSKTVNIYQETTSSVYNSLSDSNSIFCSRQPFSIDMPIVADGNLGKFNFTVEYRPAIDSPKQTYGVYSSNVSLHYDLCVGNQILLMSSI